MARTKGRLGALYVTTPKSNPQAATYTSVNAVEIGQLRNWSFDETVDTVDVADLGDAWHEPVSTLRGWTGSTDGFLDPSAAVNQDEILNMLMTGDFAATLGGTSGDLEGSLLGLFVMDDDQAYGAKKTFFGNILLTGFSPTAAVDGVITFTTRFSGVGKLGYTSVG